MHRDVINTRLLLLLLLLLLHGAYIDAIPWPRAMTPTVGSNWRLLKIERLRDETVQQIRTTIALCDMHKGAAM
jgi:hypothetical protein